MLPAKAKLTTLALTLASATAAFGGAPAGAQLAPPSRQALSVFASPLLAAQASPTRHYHPRASHRAHRREGALLHRRAVAFVAGRHRAHRASCARRARSARHHRHHAHSARCLPRHRHLLHRSITVTRQSTPKLPASSSSAPCTNTDLQPTPANLEQVRAATVCLVNRERTQRGLVPLTVNPILQSVAQAKSNDMVARDYFEHTSPDGVTPEDRILHSGYLPSGVSYAIGENIAYGTLDLGTPTQIVSAWMHSPGHRENILDPEYRDTGMGVAPAAPPSLADGQPGGTYTQEFGVHG